MRTTIKFMEEEKRDKMNDTLFEAMASYDDVHNVYIMTFNGIKENQLRLSA